MLARLAPVVTARGGVFTTAAAREVGIVREDIDVLLRTGEARRLRRGVYAPRSIVDAASRHAAARHALDGAAAIAAVDPPAWLSHLSGAVVLGLPLRQAPTAVELTRPVGAVSNAPKGVRLHRRDVPAGVRTTAFGVPALAPARTVIDLCGCLDLPEALAVADAALRLGLVTPGGLVEQLLDAENLPWRRLAARVVSAADPGGETWLESYSRGVLLLAELPPPLLQVEISDAAGFVGRVDMLWRELGVIGEADGRTKYADPEALWREKLREERLRELGYEIVRWTWAEIVYHPERVVARLRAAFARAASRGSLPAA